MFFTDWELYNDEKRKLVLEDDYSSGVVVERLPSEMFEKGEILKIVDEIPGDLRNPIYKTSSEWMGEQIAKSGI